MKQEKERKPETLIENLANIQHLKGIFGTFFNSYVWEYQNIIFRWNNPSNNEYLKSIGLVNPYMTNQEDELFSLLCKINGFVSHCFETMAYALDYIRVTTMKYNRSVTSKEYDQAIKLLKKNEIISFNESKELLKFRKKRNRMVHHYEFCIFFFERRDLIYGLLDIIDNTLQNMEPRNIEVYLQRNPIITNELECMKEVLDDLSLKMKARISQE